MLIQNMAYKQRETGQYLGTIKNNGSFSDCYIDNNKIIIVNFDKEVSLNIIELENNPNNYLFTPFIEAYNFFCYSYK